MAKKWRDDGTLGLRARRQSVAGQRLLQTLPDSAFGDLRGRQILFLVRLGLDETTERDIHDGACLTVETGLLFRNFRDGLLWTTSCPRA